MDGNYYIFTTEVYDTIDINKIYSRWYDIAKSNVTLLATEPLTGFSNEFSSDTETLTYIQNNQSSWPYLGELVFEMEYIPAIDDI